MFIIKKRFFVLSYLLIFILFSCDFKDKVHNDLPKSIDAIEIDADEILIDGPHTPIMGNQRDSIIRGVIGGDKLFHCVSAASIIAKVYRDKFMIELHQKYPQYNFQKNKGSKKPPYSQYRLYG